MSEKILHVRKRNGTLVPFNVENINKVIKWACEDVSGVNISDIEVNAKLNLMEGITTKEIHKVLVESAVNLFDEHSPNYQIVASRLLNYQLRKDVWGGKNPPKLYDFITSMTERGLYHKDILDLYTKAEIDKLDEKINHDRDYLFVYAGLQQLRDKYLMQNRKTKQVFETPQFAYMLVAMASFINYPVATRLSQVKASYDDFSKHKINLPTPQMAGVRGQLKQYASCCLIDVGDSKESIFSSNTAVGYATSQRYGIGLNFGRIRAIGSSIKNGEVIHTGLIPFLKVFEATVKSCQQNGIRGGGATVNVPFWHFEIEDVMMLKNNGGTESNRVRKMDYVIQFSRLFYERFQKLQSITLFSPNDVPELTESFGLPEFDELYLKAEANPLIIHKRTVAAKDFMALFIQQRGETSRIYAMNMDHCNEHSPWLERVTMTNLCVAGDTEVSCLIKDKSTDETAITILSINELNDLWHQRGESKIYILSKNVETGEQEFSEIEDSAMTNPSAEIIEIEDSEGRVLVRCTEDHQIYTKNRGYVKAGELLETDELDLVD